MAESDTTSETAVIAVAALFGIRTTSVERVRGGFSEAAVFRVLNERQQAFALRRTPEHAVGSLVRLRELHALLTRMQSAGLSIIAAPMSLTQTPDGPVRRRSRLETNEEAASPTFLQREHDVWQAERWIAGRPVEGVPSRPQLQAAIAALHVFYGTAKRVVGNSLPNDHFFVAERCSPGIQRRLQIVRELTDGLLPTFRRAIPEDPDASFRMLASRVCRTLDRWLPWLSSHLAIQATRRFWLQPVIRDLWSAHVLYEGEQVTGFIDLSAMASDHVAFDLSRLLRSWFGSDQVNIREGFEVCRDAGILASADWSLLQTLDACTVLLSPVTWLRRRLLSPQRIRCSPEILERLSRLTETAEGFEPL